MQEEGDERESICPSTHPFFLTCMCSLTHPTSTFDKTLFSHVSAGIVGWVISAVSYFSVMKGE